MTTAFLADDLTVDLFTLLKPLVVIWVRKMVHPGRVGKRPLGKSQINSKNAMVSQTIDCRAGDQLEDVTDVISFEAHIEFKKGKLHFI